MPTNLTVPDFAMVELAPIAVGELRAATTQSKETVLGKRNRISIGQPLVRQIEPGHVDGLLTAEHLPLFDPKLQMFHQLEMAVTLLPDKDCRFISADVILKLSPADGEFPMLLCFEPERKTTLKTVTHTRDEAARAGIKDNLLNVLEVGVETRKTSEDSWEGESVHLESFGAQTAEGGWRMRMTESREIPLNTRGLRCIVVHAAQQKLMAEFRVVAEIDIRTSIDRWFTWAFGAKQDNAPNLTLQIAG